MIKNNIKNTAWKYFSAYIRIVRCMETTGNKDYGKCCTCGNIYHIKKLEAGHFVSGRSDAILFEEDGVHCQCKKCNRHGQGMWAEYYEFMLAKYGQDRTEELRKMKFKVRRYKDFELQEIKNYYRKELKKVNDGKVAL